MDFEEIVLQKTEFKILSELADGKGLSFKHSAINAPYFIRLAKIGLIAVEHENKSGTLDIWESEFQACITPLGENYFIYASQKKREDRFLRLHTTLNSCVAIAALIVAIVALFR